MDLMYTDDMREISGFGGGYEEACRRMAVAGAMWLRANVSDERLSDLKAMGSGWVTAPEHDTLDRVVGEAEPGCSGAMHGAAMAHALHIRVMGWDAYAEKMRELKRGEVQP